jgi:colicin import membrane protein
MTDTTPYSVPKEPGRWRALTLAAVVHAALFALLWFGVRWQSETPVAIEAEVWSPQVREAAPRPQPEPEPEIKPEPKPEVKPIPKPAEVEPPVVKPPVVKPDIALELEKKRKAQQQKEREQLARLEKQRAEDKRRAEDKQLAEEKRIEKEKADALAKKKREADDLKKQMADKKRQQELLDQALRNKARNEDLKRMMAQAGTGGTGDAPKTQGSRGSAEYSSRVGAKIKSNTIFNVPENVAGNPAVEYAVELLPDGSIRRPIRKLKSSGVAGFDEAVLNAIEKSQPYPPDKSGTVPSGFNVIHRPKDQ